MTELTTDERLARMEATLADMKRTLDFIAQMHGMVTWAGGGGSGHYDPKGSTLSVGGGGAGCGPAPLRPSIPRGYTVTTGGS